MLGVVAVAAVEAATLPHNIPDFSLDASRATIQSARTGSWSDPATWQGGQIPTANHVVRVMAGHTVTINDTSPVAYTIAVDGKLAFATNVSTRLKVTNLLVMAGENGDGTPGVLEIGTTATPIAANVTAELVIANSPFGGGIPDPEQFGHGLLVFGRMSAHGTLRTPTFLRLATEPLAGQTTLALSEAVSGWQAGDRLVLPDTRHIKESEVLASDPWINAVNQWEERTLQAVSADGRTLTLTSALQYDHLGARDLDGVLDFLPHVGNLTRNVVIRSESATGTRGHVLATHMANVDVRYALFKDLGRTTYQPLNTTTNLIGRYPVHMHHLAGPMTTPANGFQFTLLGNAVDGGSVETKFKWGIAIHDSHYGSIQDNVVYNYNGAAIATEDGSESFNVFDHNFALRGMGEPNNTVSEARMAMGTEGVGFWFRGPNNYVRNNVAANYQNPTTEAAYGFVYQFRFLGNISVPNVKGAMDATQFTTRNGNNMPLLQFENNEAYGAMQGGATFWWVGSEDPQPFVTQAESVVKDLKLWHIYNKTVYMYPAHRMIFDGLTIRGNYDAAESRCCGNGVYFADYSSKGIVIRNSDIQGMDEGITAPEAGFGPEANLTIENTYLRNDSNLEVPWNGSVNGCWMDNKIIVATNTRFAAPPGRTLHAIGMVNDVASAPECLGKLDELRVYAYNGVATDNFQVYHSLPSVLPRPPASCVPQPRPGIDGLVCPIAAASAAATVTPAASTVPAGAPVVFTVVNNGTASAMDWLALYRTSAPDSAYLTWQFMNGLTTPAPSMGLTTATLRFSAPLTPGTYEVRFFSNNTFGRLATSSTITVPAPTIAATSPTVAAGTSIDFVAAGGPANPADWVGLFATSAADTGYVAWQFLNGSTTSPTTGLSGATLRFRAPLIPGTYEARFFRNNTYTRLATSGMVTVTGVVPSVTLTSTTVSPGSPIGFVVAGGPANPLDWVALYRTTTSDGAYIAWQFLNGTTMPPPTGRSGATLQFVAPTTPGTYEVRFFSNNTFVRLATSGPVTVTRPAASVTLAATTLPLGAPIRFSIAGGASATDWVGLYPLSAPDTGYLAWQFLNGTTTAPPSGISAATLQFSSPPAPGAYELRFFSSNTYTRLATSGILTVTAVVPSVTLTSTTVSPGSPIGFVVAGGPANPLDWVALYRTTTGDDAYIAWQFLNGAKMAPSTGTSGATLQFVAPTAPGTYEIRFFSNNTFLRLATSGPVTVGAF